MISKINETVLEALYNVNKELNNIHFNNNIITYENESFDLKDFSLQNLFQSYQLKVNLNDIPAKELFKIIKLNATVSNEDTFSLIDFKNLITAGNSENKIIQYIDLIKYLEEYQFYLTENVFAKYLEYKKIYTSLEKLDKEILNPAQKMIVEKIKAKNTINIQSFTPSIPPNDPNDGGMPRKYTPNGYVSGILVIIMTLAVGITLAINLLPK